MARKEFKSQISLNTPGIVPSPNIAGSTAAAGLQLSEISASLFAEHERDIKENEPRLKRMGAAAGMAAGNDPQGKMRDIESSQVFDIAYDKTFELSYLARTHIDATETINQIRQDNFDNPKEFRAISEAYRDETVSLTDPRLKDQVELEIDKLIVNGFKATSDVAWEATRTRNARDILASSQLDIDSLLDQITQFGRMRYGDTVDSNQDMMIDSIKDKWQSLVNNKTMSEHDFLVKTRALDTLILESEGEFLINQMVADGKTLPEIEKFIQDTAQGKQPFTKGKGHLAGTVAKAMTVHHDTLTTFDQAQAVRDEAANLENAEQRLNIVHTNMVKDKTKLEAMYFSGDTDGVNKWFQKIFDEINSVAADHPDLEEKTGPQYRRAYELLNELIASDKAYRESGEIVAQYQQQNSTAPADAKTRKAYDDKFEGLVKQGKIDLTDETGWQEEDLLAVRNLIQGAGYVPKFFQGILSNPNKTPEVTIAIGKILGPALDPRNRNAGEILRSLPTHSAAHWQLIAKKSRLGALSPTDAEALAQGIDGMSREDKIKRVTALVFGELKEGETFESKWNELALSASQDDLDDSDVSGILHLDDVFSMNNLRDTGGWFGPGSEAKDILDNVWDLMWMGGSDSFVNDELPERMQAQYQEILKNEILRADLREDNIDEGIEFARERALARVKADGRWGVSYVGGGHGRVVENAPEAEVQNVPEDMPFAATILFEAGVAEALAPFSKDGFWDGDKFNAMEALNNGTLEIHSLGDGDYGFTYVNDYGIREQIKHQGEDGLQQVFTFNYNRFHDMKDGVEDGSVDKTNQHFIRRAAEIAQANGATPFDKSLIFQEVYYRLLKEQRGEFLPESAGFLTQVQRRLQYTGRVIGDALKGIDLLPEMPTPQDRVSLKRALKMSREAREKAAADSVVPTPKGD
ncbi:MAG: hypothetical protein ABGY96_24330 [bacterium]